MRVLKYLFVIALVSFVRLNVNATSMSVELNCPSTIYADTNFTCNVVLNASDGVINGITFNYSFENVTFSSFVPANDWSPYENSSNGVAIGNLSGVSGNNIIGKINLISNGNVGSTMKVGIKNIDGSDTDDKSVSATNVVKNINIVEKEVVTTITTAINTTKKTTTKINSTTTKNNLDNTLKSLIIKNVDINFNKNVYEYQISVNNDIDKLEIIYETTNKNSRVEIVGNNLVEGENTVILKVIAPDNSEVLYKLNVIRKSLEVNKIEFNKLKLIDAIKNNKNNLEIDIDINDKYKIIEKEILDIIKDNNITVRFNIKENNTIIYYVILNSSNINHITNDLDLSINNDLSEDITLKSINYRVINLLDNSTLNKIDIYYNTKLFTGNSLYLYVFDKNLDLINEYNKNNDFITLNLEDNQYLLSGEKISKISGLNNNIFILLGIVLVICILTIVSVVVMVVVKKKNNKYTNNSNNNNIETLDLR